MKRIFIFAFLLVVGLGNVSSFAETATVTANATFQVADVFTLEFYEEEPNKYLYTTNIPFTNMDPTKTWVQADGRGANDQKNDVGILCKSNMGEVWYLKIKGSASSLITIGRLQYGLWQPWNRSWNPPWGGQAVDGIVASGAGWHNVPTEATIVYTAGNKDKSNLPGGTLCGFSFAINPSKLDPKLTHQCIIQFTLTTSI